MLKFLTHKLRTHSLNEENVSEKVEERDSGTESDDEAERADTGDFCTDVIMKWNDVTDISNAERTILSPTILQTNNNENVLNQQMDMQISSYFQEGSDATGRNTKDRDSAEFGMGGEACACAPTPPRLLPEPEPDHLYDHHSSEEELEVINGAPSGADAGPATGSGAGAAPESRRRGASSPPPSAPEKRKWPAQPYHDADDLAARAPSSDDDDTKVETPVRFRTSPPLEALKPRRAGACACSGSAGAPERAPLSPRRRRMPLPPPRRHRPALDFDKMQQLKVGGGVRSWRAGGAHSGELSVFCW